jgi:hypothetical protein
MSDDTQCCRTGTIDDGLTMLISEWQNAAIEAGLDQTVGYLCGRVGEWLHSSLVVFDKESEQMLLDSTKIIGRIHEIAGAAEIPKEFLIMSMVSGIGDSLSTTGTADFTRAGKLWIEYRERIFPLRLWHTRMGPRHPSSGSYRIP